MARAAVLGRLSWRVATVAAVRDEAAGARTIVLDVPGWPGHAAGQHVDLRLTAADGYSTQRSYSIASAPDGERIELTVVSISGGEVSPYLTEVAEAGDQMEVRGPVGGWFVWQPDAPDPVFLLGGGSGLVPLMAMIRSRAAAGSRAEFRLLYSVRDPSLVLYRYELRERAAESSGLSVTCAFTRSAPPGSARPAGQIDAGLIAAAGWPPARRPAIFACGPTGFVEAAANLLVDLGHDPGRIKTERFGPSGGTL
ncbi:MAG: ferredoxin reductase [Streptosporangiaceae bacterium]|jgi:ferredoxin-NADP reductase